MWKRILSLALALLMGLAFLPAQAEEPVPEALYRIVERSGTGDRTLGTGVLFGSKTALLTVAGCWSEGDLYAIGADGEHAISYRGEIAGSRLILLGLATESAFSPMTVTGADSFRSNAIYGASASGGMVVQQTTLSRAAAIDRRAEVLLSAGEGLLPGAVMLGADGGLACITLWQHGEGVGVYAALANVTLSRLLNGEGVEAQESNGLVSGFVATVQDGQILLIRKTEKAEQGDIIAFYYNNKVLVRRVICTGGSSIDLDTAGAVRINGTPLEEPYVTTPSIGQSNVSYPLHVSIGQYFVMGDNRAIAMDSRLTEIGVISEDRIIGKVLFVK